MEYIMVLMLICSFLVPEEPVKAGEYPEEPIVIYEDLPSDYVPISVNVTPYERVSWPQEDIVWNFQDVANQTVSALK